MTSILSVDLAAKLSASVLRSAGGGVIHQFDSREKTPDAFIHEIVMAVPLEGVTVIEDLPFGISSQFMIKPVVRLQGALISALIRSGLDKRALFVTPSVWMAEFPGTQHAPRGLSKSASDAYRIEQARIHAEEAGYTPPDLITPYVRSLPEGKKALKKDTNVLAKSMTDYVSAFLLSEFCRMHTFEELLAMPGVSRATL